jgi:hypothetical protein
MRPVRALLAHHDVESNLMQYIVYWGVTAVVAAILAAIIAPMKNRDYNSWAAWCFLFPPLLIALILTPKSSVPPRRPPTLDQLDQRDDRFS